jgi:hypothetical protein
VLTIGFIPFPAKYSSISTNRITLDTVEYGSYAQYDNAVKLTFTPQGKRTKYYNWWYKEVLVYDGWLELPETVLNEVTHTGSGTTITSSKYLSCDRKQYDEILEYFEGSGIKPIVSTYKPTF